MQEVPRSQDNSAFLHAGIDKSRKNVERLQSLNKYYSNETPTQMFLIRNLIPFRHRNFVLPEFEPYEFGKNAPLALFPVQRKQIPRKTVDQKRKRLEALTQLLRKPELRQRILQQIAAATNTFFTFSIGSLIQFIEVVPTTEAISRILQFERFLKANEKCRELNSTYFRVVKDLNGLTIQRNHRPILDANSTLVLECNHVHLPLIKEKHWNVAFHIVAKDFNQAALLVWSSKVSALTNNSVYDPGLQIDIHSMMGQFDYGVKEYVAIVLKFTNSITPETAAEARHFYGFEFLYKSSTGFCVGRKVISLVPQVFVRQYAENNSCLESNLRALMKAEMDVIHPCWHVLINVHSDAQRLKMAVNEQRGAEDDPDEWRCVSNCPARQIKAKLFKTPPAYLPNDSKKIETIDITLSQQQNILHSLNYFAFIFQRGSPHMMSFFNAKLRFQNNYEYLASLIDTKSRGRIFFTCPRLREVLEPFLNVSFPPVLCYEFCAVEPKGLAVFRRHIHDNIIRQSKLWYNEGFAQCYIRGDDVSKCVFCRYKCTNFYQLLFHYETFHYRLYYNLRMSDDLSPLLLGTKVVIEVCINDDDFDDYYDEDWMLDRRAAEYTRNNLRMDLTLWKGDRNPHLKLKLCLPDFLNENDNPVSGNFSWQEFKKQELEYMFLKLHSLPNISRKAMRFIRLWNYFLWAIGPNYLKGLFYTYKLFLIVNLCYIREYKLKKKTAQQIIHFLTTNSLTADESEDLITLLRTDKDPYEYLYPQNCGDSGFANFLLRRLDAAFDSNNRQSFAGAQNLTIDDSHPILSECIEFEKHPGSIVTKVGARCKRTLILQHFGPQIQKKDPLFKYKINVCRVITGCSKPPDYLSPPYWVIQYDQLHRLKKVMPEVRARSKSVIRSMVACMGWTTYESTSSELKSAVEDNIQPPASAIWPDKSEVKLDRVGKKRLNISCDTFFQQFET